jgi:preprotein translocase SecE subunit
VARDRQRAKQRKARRPSPGGRDRVPDEGNGLTPDPQPLHRENVPAPVEHTGEVDEFEAALVAGAGGEPEDEPGSVDRAAVGETDADAERLDEDAPSDAELEQAAVATGGPAAASSRSVDAAAHGRGGSRFLNFLRASWAELQRVQWPDRRQVGQATLVVMGFVVVAGAFLGLADYVAKQLVDLII